MKSLDFLWLFLGIVWIGACVCLLHILKQWQRERIRQKQWVQDVLHLKPQKQRGIHEPF